MQLVLFATENFEGLFDLFAYSDTSRVNCGRQKYWFWMW
jgi:hypothetical protein